MIAIPEQFFLDGEGITIRQERDGAIAVFPAEEQAREELWARFNPFTEWEKGTWPKEKPVWQDED